MKLSDAAYFADRAETETRLAAACANRAARRAHSSLATAYVQKVSSLIEAESPYEQVVPSPAQSPYPA